MATRGTLLGALVVVFVTVLNLTSSSPDLCSRPPFWGVTDENNPLLNNKGKVVLLTLTKASCAKCREHLKRLDALMKDWHDLGMVEMELVAVAAKEHDRWLSRLSKDTEATIYVDDRDKSLYQAFQGKVNDVLIYDRCGKMAFFVPWGENKQVKNHMNLIENALSRTYTMDVCPGSCNPDPEPPLDDWEKKDKEKFLEMVIEEENEEVAAKVPTTTTEPKTQNPQHKKSLWEYFKSFLFSEEEDTHNNNSDENIKTSTVRPGREQSMSRQGVCDRLGRNYCNATRSLKALKRDHVCCAIVHESNTGGAEFAKKCSRFLHTVKHCSKVALVDICCRIEKGNLEDNVDNQGAEI